MSSEHIINHFVKDNEFVSFLIGVFTELSIVYNISFLLSSRKKRNKNIANN